MSRSFLRCWLAGVIATAGIFIATGAWAGEGLDVKDWLSRPGVKLLVVEFYASWCGPCKAAVPRWAELHERYRDRGLRLVVVSVQDPDGACVNPGWNPDDVICDTDGRLAEAMTVGDRLPSAFLWSWRGNLLVGRGHVDEVERAVEKELARLPRVTLDEGMDQAVREPLRSELARTGKVDVVAGPDEQAALDEIRRKSHGLQFASQSTCTLGEQLAANSLLKATFVGEAKGRRLLLQLFSADTGCLHVSAGVYWNEERPDLSVAEAVAKLVNGLRGAVQFPGKAVPQTMTERDLRETADEWSFQGTTGSIVAFQTDPPGAVMLMDGKVLCQSTPCSKLVVPGMHVVEFQLENYLPVRERIPLSEKTGTVQRTLKPDFGWISVRSVPSGIPVTLDGRPWGTTPIERRQVSTGPHRVMVTDPLFLEEGKDLVVTQGGEHLVEVTLTPRVGGLEVHATDLQDNDLRGEVFVDGVSVGYTPYSQTTPVGQHQVRVVQGDLSAERSITVREREVASLRLELKPAANRSIEAERLRKMQARRPPAATVSGPAKAPPPASSLYAARPLLKEKGGGELFWALFVPAYKYSVGEYESEWTDSGDVITSRSEFRYGVVRSWETSLGMDWLFKTPAEDFEKLQRVSWGNRFGILPWLASGLGLSTSPNDPNSETTRWTLGADFRWALGDSMSVLAVTNIGMNAAFESESFRLLLGGALRYSMGRSLFGELALAASVVPSDEVDATTVDLDVIVGATLGQHVDLGLLFGYSRTTQFADSESETSSEQRSLGALVRILF
jgi:thiol-disulfide isomerase/thioredoxin